MTVPQPNHPVQTACPHIGLQQDPDSLVSYPTAANLCYRCRPQVTPSREHQSLYCLSSEYRACPIIQAGDKEITLPAELQWNQQRSGVESLIGAQNWDSSVIGLLIVFALAIIVIMGIWMFKLSSSFVASAGQATLPPPELNRAIYTPTSPLLSQTPSPGDATQNASPLVSSLTPAVSTEISPLVLIPLDTPLGSARKFIIHRMLEGENLQLLARRNKTKQELILQTTYNLSVPVWAGKLVVIPVNQSDLEGVPLFEPYEITQTEISTAELAQLLGVDLPDLEFYNACVGCRFQKGSWILIPHSR